MINFIQAATFVTLGSLSALLATPVPNNCDGTKDCTASVVVTKAGGSQCNGLSHTLTSTTIDAVCGCGNGTGNCVTVVTCVAFGTMTILGTSGSDWYRINGGTCTQGNPSVSPQVNGSVVGCGLVNCPNIVIWRSAGNCSGTTNKCTFTITAGCSAALGCSNQTGC